ncbi:hypothetical protein ACFW2V_13825 [Streptomyces sp. NPDC058947]|uniref:hypothetical protein n=1 Tax=Streptomyces sp. NPDC058947 TaxID=3346675 RepID=UPI00367E6B9D
MSSIISARDRLHIKRCKGKCILETDQPDTDCRDLTYYLDQVEEQALHWAAVRVLDLHYDAVLRHGADVGQGLALAAKEVDPYMRRDGSLVRQSDGTPAPRFPRDGLD